LSNFPFFLFYSFVDGSLTCLIVCHLRCISCSYGLAFHCSWESTRRALPIRGYTHST
jgi:hypothetical protein